MHASKEVIILGGGLSGLSMAYNLVRVCGLKPIVIEASDRFGGLLKTIEKNGFLFDVGGSHILFSKNKNALEELLYFLKDNYIQHYRNTYIYYWNKQFIKYPFENGIYMLDPIERYEILKDIIELVIMREKGVLKKPENLLQWFYYVFGKAISEKYLIPYNLKLWKRDLREISLEWVGDRVPQPPLDDIIKSAVGIPTEGYKHQLIFYYPMKGGINALIEGILDHLLKDSVGLHLREKVVSITLDMDGVSIETTKGEYKARYVVSTIPVLELIKITKDSGNELKKYVRELDYNSLLVIGIGAKTSIKNMHWIYFPQEDIVFHRIAFLSNYSPYMAPQGKASIIAEISINPKENPSPNIDSLVSKTISSLEDLGIIERGSVETIVTQFWKYAYIVYNHFHRKAMDYITTYYSKYNVFLTGRFGLWEYSNMDKVWIMAKELSNKICSILNKAI